MTEITQTYGFQTALIRPQLQLFEILSPIQIRIDEIVRSIRGPAREFVEIGQVIGMDAHRFHGKHTRQDYCLNLREFSISLFCSSEDHRANHDEHEGINRQEMSKPDIQRAHHADEKIDQRRNSKSDEHERN